MHRSRRVGDQEPEAVSAQLDRRISDLDQARAALLADLFHRIPLPKAAWSRYLVATLIIAVALALRMMILPADGGLPFITFYPAVVVAVFLCGFGPGLMASVLSLILGYLALTPPLWSAKLAVADLPPLAVFFGSALVICLIIERMLRLAGMTSLVNQHLNASTETLNRALEAHLGTEQALRDSEEKFRSLFENAAIGKAVVSSERYCLQANPALCALLGFSEAELLNISLPAITHPDDVDLDRPLVEDLIAGRCESFRVEKRYFARSGEIVRVLLSVSMLRHSGPEPRFIAQFQDITEQKRAEQKAQRLTRIVTMMSEGNQAVVHATDEAALFQAMCDVVVEYGGYLMAWMGVVEHDAAKTIRPVAHAGHEDGYLDRVTISWGDGSLGAGPSGLSVRTGQPQINNDFSANASTTPWRHLALVRGYRSSISLPLKDRGGVFGCLTLYAAEPDSFGAEEVKLLTELAEDVAYGITALRTRRDHDSLERTLFQAQKMESLGQLTGGVAHDFNNLLQVILSNLDLSLQALGGSPTVAGYLQNAINGAEQGAKLTGHLLAFARRQPLRPEPLRVDRLVGEMTNILRRTIGETIDIELVTSGGLWTALVDSNQLQNAILNLAINARDAMPNGGKLTVELANAALDGAYAAEYHEVKPGQYVMVAITDTGSGIPAEVLERVYEPFFTTKPEGRGTGLGLSMVYGFVKQSGGHIKIYSELGQGTTIKLYLPRSQQSAVQSQAETAAALRHGNGETILVAEDDDAVRASVVTQLAELGYRVLAVPTGEAALAILERGETVDLLFTDVVMPGRFNGRALADRARQLVPGLVVVFTSGYTENAIIHHGRLDEGVTLLSKPYRLRQLAETIRAALPQPSLPEPAADAPPPPGTKVLLVEDDDLIRDALAECLDQLGYAVVAVGRPSEALAHLATAEVEVLISDFTLPEMNGIALAAEALARDPRLAVVLASGHNLSRSDLPDPKILTVLKPFRPQDIDQAIKAALDANGGLSQR